MNPTNDYRLPRTSPATRPGTFPLPPPPNDWYALKSEVAAYVASLTASIALKQDLLVSGSNIKTVNGQSLLGSGNLQVTAPVQWGTIAGTLANQSDLSSALSSKADRVASPVAGNLASLDSSGNLVDSGKKASDFDSAGAAASHASDQSAHATLFGTKQDKINLVAGSIVKCMGNGTVAAATAADVPGLSGKQDASNLVASFSDDPSDERYPSEKLVKGSLDGCVKRSDFSSIDPARVTIKQLAQILKGAS